MFNYVILTGVDGAGKTTIWNHVKKNMDYIPTNQFLQFPTREIKESLIKLDEPEYGSLTRHKVFEADFERLRLENMDKENWNINFLLDRFYVDNMAYSLYFNPEIPLEMFDLTRKFMNKNNKIHIVHISPNTTLWRDKYNHDEVHEEFKDRIETCYHKVFMYLVRKYVNRVSVKLVYNMYDGQAEKEVLSYFQNV